MASGQERNFSVPTGSQVTLTANANVPYEFGNWTGTQCYSGNPISLVIKSNIEETANFKILKAVVTFSETGLDSSISQIILTVDENTYSVAALPISFNWILGSTHSFSWTGSVQSGSGVEYQWQATTGLVTAQSGTITVTTEGKITGEYVSIIRSTSTSLPATSTATAGQPTSVTATIGTSVSTTSPSITANAQNIQTNTYQGNPPSGDSTVTIAAILGASIIIATGLAVFARRRR